MLPILFLQLLRSTQRNHSSSLYSPSSYHCIDPPLLLYLPIRITHVALPLTTLTRMTQTNTLPKRKGHAKSSILIRRNRSIDVVHISESLQKRNATSGGDASVASSERKLILATNTQHKVRESRAKRTARNRKHHVNRINRSHGKVIKSKRTNAKVVDETAKGNRKAGLDVVADLELPHTLHETVKTLSVGFNTLQNTIVRREHHIAFIGFL